MTKEKIIGRLLLLEHINSEEAKLLLGQDNDAVASDKIVINTPNISMPGEQEVYMPYVPVTKLYPNNPYHCVACQNGGACNCVLGGMKVTCNATDGRLYTSHISDFRD